MSGFETIYQLSIKLWILGKLVLQFFLCKMVFQKFPI